MRAGRVAARRMCVSPNGFHHTRGVATRRDLDGHAGIRDLRQACRARVWIGTIPTRSGAYVGEVNVTQTAAARVTVFTGATTPVRHTTWGGIHEFHR